MYCRQRYTDIEKLTCLLYLYLCVSSIVSIVYLIYYFSGIFEDSHQHVVLAISFIMMIMSCLHIIWFIMSTVLLVKYTTTNNRVVPVTPPNFIRNLPDAVPVSSIQVNIQQSN